MKKLFAILLFALTFVCMASENVYAGTDEYTYTEYVDEVAGMEKPYWSFDYYPELKYEHKFLIFNWGEAETVSWDIDTVSYYFTMNNEHVGEYLIGYNPSDMEIIFEYVYSSVNENMDKYTSESTFRYSLAEKEFNNGYVEYEIPYEEVLAGSEYYNQGYNTLIKSVKVSIVSKVLSKVGTSMYYEFSYDDNYKKQIYTGIKFYKINDTDKLLISETAGSYKSDDDGLGDGNGGEIEKHHYVVIYPDSIQEDMFNLNDVLTLILVEFPRAIWKVIVFLYEFIAMLPEMIHMAVPFLPEPLIAAFMFVVTFGVIWGIILWLHDLKGA